MQLPHNAVIVGKRKWPRTVGLSVRDESKRVAIVHVANTFWSRFVGLLGRRTLAQDEGLLFVPGASIHTLGMRFPIDLVFMDASMKVLRVVADVRPWRFVFAPRRARFVLELNSGAARDAHIQEHDALKFV